MFNIRDGSLFGSDVWFGRFSILAHHLECVDDQFTIKRVQTRCNRNFKYDVGHGVGVSLFS